MLMQCVTTTSMRVKINGEMTEWFLPRVGLRQGDPLSPSLYVMCANVLSNHLITAQNYRSIQGIKIARGAPSINHLMYADDILLFFRADKSTCDTVNKLLNQFGELAGLWMNNQKSETAHGCDAAKTEEHIFKDCQFAKRVWFASRLNLRSDDINALSMSDWITQNISNLSKTSSPQHKEIVMLLLSICWSLYTQRNQLIFQQGKADVTKCLNRAYKIVDEIVGIDIIQRQDHFFNLEVPMKQRGDGSRTTEHNAGGIVLTCSWKKDSSTRRKVFDIFHQLEGNQKLLCSMVTEDDQDDCLALLRSVRLFLEDYGRDQMGPITFNIPSKNIITHLNHRPIAHISIVTTTSSPKVFLPTGLLGGIL
ncbi:ribonuclease H [Senna tora]|uniref:Ribonuclease H n=1 Tax=Senna tora TaxID=362788 RepID=A0A834TLA2_9FABA|nr:ribonuclease H [Senna tora]